MSYVHRRPLRSQGSWGWLRASIYLCVTLLFSRRPFPQSPFPQYVYTGPREGRFGCWKWLYVTIQVIALGMGHPRRHSQENGPSAWILIHGRTRVISLLPQLASIGAPPPPTIHEANVLLEAGITTLVPHSLFTSWPRSQECLLSADDEQDETL